MGILARMLGFIWRRWADYQSVVAILDVLDLKTAVGGSLGFVGMIFVGATNMGWSAPTVLLAALAAGALVSITMVAIRIFWRLKPTKSVLVETQQNEFSADIPNVRVADDMVAWNLFAAPHHDKLLPLLERGKIEAWGRLGNGGPPLTLIPAAQWTTHYLDFRSSLGGGSINQTFFRPKSRPYESTYFDVYLNRSQIERGWSGLWSKPFRISLQDFLHDEAVKSGWGPRPGNTADLGDLIDRIRQAAVDGDLRLWGKQMPVPLNSQALKGLPLLPIEKEYWRSHEIDYLRAIFYDQGNDGTRSQREFSGSNDQQERYYDLHLGTEEALAWLRNKGRPK
jgi:hypothetical protein